MQVGVAPPLRSSCRRSAFGLLACGTDADDVPGQMTTLECGDQPGAGVDLAATESVSSGGGKGMVVVVPRLSEGQRRKPREISGLVVGGERSATEGMAQRVDTEGGVMQEEDAHRSAPQECGEPAAERAGQCHPEAERDRQP